MAHPLQPHYDRVSALLKELRTALNEHPIFRSHHEEFDEYLEANELNWRSTRRPMLFCVPALGDFGMRRTNAPGNPKVLVGE
jgi:hypothetical protein